MATKEIKDIKSTAKESVQSKVKTDVKAEALVESVYTAEELAQGALNAFGARPECVVTALKLAGKSSATISEAKTIVNEFLSKEAD